MPIYEAKLLIKLEPWTPDFDMSMVKVADMDKVTGSPQAGDMIAINPRNSADMWLVSEAVFKKKYKLVTDK